MKKMLIAFGCLFAAVALVAAPPAVMEPDDHTAAFWDFSLQKDGVIQDQSGFGNDMTLGSFDKMPVPVITADEGMVMDNQGGYAQLKPKESTKIRKGDFAIEVVFKAQAQSLKKNGTGFALIGNKSASEKVSGFSLGYSTWQKYSFYFNYALNNKACSFSAIMPAPLQADTWYTLCLSRKGDKLIMTLDGKVIAEETVAGDLNLTNLRPIRVGVYSAAWQRNKENKIIANGLVGTIRYIRISDTAR